MLPEHIKEVYAKSTQLYSKADIEAALDKMAGEMIDRIADKNPIFLCIVVGGIVPLGNLLPRLDFPLEMDYIHVSRYGDAMHGESGIKWKAKPTMDLNGRTIIVVDDILDEGVTLATVIDYCYKQNAKEVLSAVLVDKKKERTKGSQTADFYGLIIEDKFVFGYGLDYKGYLRNAPGIYAVAPEHMESDF